MGTRVGLCSRRDLLYTSLTAAWKCFEFEFQRGGLRSALFVSYGFDGWGGGQRLS
jgi:hypothetical protein